MKGQENWLLLVPPLREWTMSSNRSSSHGMAKGPGHSWAYSSYAWSSSCRKTGWFSKSALTTNLLLASPTTTARWPGGTSRGGFFSLPLVSLRFACNPFFFSFAMLQIMPRLEYCSVRGAIWSMRSEVSDLFFVRMFKVDVGIYLWGQKSSPVWSSTIDSFTQ